MAAKAGPTHERAVRARRIIRAVFGRMRLGKRSREKRERASESTTKTNAVPAVVLPSMPIYARAWTILAVLAVLTLLVFSQVATHAFITYDDPGYVTANGEVKAGLSLEGIGWAFTALTPYYWQPLTWLTHMLDVQLFGLHAGPMLIVNMLTHLASTLLLFLLLRRMTGAVWRSAIVAALFAVHPLHVESVAWVAERKDVLSTLFFMLTLWAYVRYVERPRTERFAWVIVFFIL